jgi:manganese oxidase
MSTGTQRAAFAVAFTLIGAITAAALLNPSVLAPAPAAKASSGPGVRSFEFDIKGADIDMGGGAVWHAWTYNGTVPGPTLTATVGDMVRITVHNTLNITHSLHTHLSPYPLESDGSQLNVITGIGGMAMIEPGASYTYEYLANVPGIFYYHCHSASGNHGIQQHIAQGLYGAIIVSSPEEAKLEEQVVFMAERGFNATGNAPYMIMNGHGMPGGEKALEDAFHHGGMEAVQAALGTIVPTLHGKVGVPTRISVVNIGDAVHSFHLHGMTAYSLVHDAGQPVPAQVVGLVPGEADRIVVTPTQPGIWLYHCHVVSHADGGMIGVFIVDP